MIHLLMSANGTSFKSVYVQIDTAATCSTISETTVKTLGAEPSITGSPCMLYPYVNIKPIRPLEQDRLSCERQNKYETLNLHVLPQSIT